MIQAYTIYDPATGRVIRSGFSNCDQPVAAGERLLRGAEAARGQIVDTSGEEPRLREMTPAELAANSP
jgi:hypothetical protein